MGKLWNGRPCEGRGQGECMGLAGRSGRVAAAAAGILMVLVLFLPIQADAAAPATAGAEAELPAGA